MDFDSIPQSYEESKNDESNSNSDQIISSVLNLFCLDCFQIPQYAIEIETNKSISLVHICNKIEKKISVNSEITLTSFYYDNNKNKCIYCQKKCNGICIQCKKNICDECGQDHIPKENIKPPIIWIFKKGDEGKKTKRYIYPINDLQFICSSHGLKYEYFCPICKINLCEKCRDYHHHINCESLIDYNMSIKSETGIQFKDDILMENLKKLSDIFEDCYKEAKKDNKMTVNILVNYSMKMYINTFLEKYNKENKKEIKQKKIISSTFFNEKDINNYRCEYFYDKTFKKNYSNLIESFNDGDYESHFKLEVIREIYINDNKFKQKYDINEKLFYSSLKSIIENFRGKYHYLKEMLFSINLKINNNYNIKKRENLNFLIKIHETDIKLLKKINMHLLYKYDYELRRKIGNLMAELILSKYYHLLEPIEENDYILYESLILIKKKIAQINQLTGPENVLNQYEKKMETHFTNLLNKSNDKILKDINNIQKNTDKNIFVESEATINFHQINNEEKNIKEAVLLNLFFRLKKCFGSIFNDSIHNKTENVNYQIKEEIEKLRTFNLGKCNKNENEIKNKNDKKNAFAPHEIQNNARACGSFFEGINKIKKILNFNGNITIENNKNTLNIFNSLKDNEYTESNIDEFKSQMDKIFKEYEFKNETNLDEAANLLFKGEILDILTEKKTYENFNLLKKEMASIDLENAKQEVLNDFNEVEPVLNEYLKTIENMKISALMQIKKFENCIAESSKKGNDNQDSTNNPFSFLDKYINVLLYEIHKPEEIKSIYMSYLINFYFCAEDAYNYLFELKRKYKDIELINSMQKNIEKERLLDVLISRFENKEKENNYLKEEWDKLKKEKVFIEKNNLLSEKINDYLEKKDEKQFLNDLANLEKIKEMKIDLSKPDPQNLLIKAYWIKENIPLNYPSELKEK